MILKIALRNIMRHKRRTFTSAITIAVGISFFLLMDSMMAGLDRGSIDNAIELSASSVKVQTIAYENDKEAFPLKHGIANLDSIRLLLAHDPRVIAVTPRAQFLGELSNYTQTIPVVGIVCEPQTDTAVFSLGKYLTGRYPEGNAREVVLGKKLAQDMGVTIGGYLTLYALTKYDSRNADEFKVVGLLNTTNPSLNESSVLISYAAANDFLDLDGLVTEVNVALKRRINMKDMAADAADVKKQIVSAFPALFAQTFMEQCASFLELAKGKKAFGMVFLLILLLIAAVGIFNTVLMSVYERIREVGVLRAHGMHPTQVTLMFTLEGLFTGFLGSVFGLLIGIGVNWLMVAYGFPLEKMGANQAGASLPFWGTIYGEWNIPAMISLFFFGIAVSMIAGLIPARKAATMQVTEALRFV